MSKLPVIVGFGGINTAGRTSFHHGYRRLIHEVLNEEDKAEMFKGLATMMGLDEKDREAILAHTLIRKIEPQTIDFASYTIRKKAQMEATDGPIVFTCRKRQIPASVPESWQIEDLGAGKVRVTINDSVEALLADAYQPKVTSAGQIPTGFDPGSLYNSRNQPKGLQLAVFAASDALMSVGIPWQTIIDSVNPDQVSVYAASAIGQQDDYGTRGLQQSMQLGGRVSSKQMSMQLTEMPADFVNSYITNTAGNTGANIGACATFLYNLRQAVHDIQSGVARVAIVGGAEAPITPEILEGFCAMGALAEDEQIKALDGSDEVDNRRACRPFSDNAGFTIAEAAHYFVLMDDELALELGASIYGAVPDVFVNADANKKSISAPGIGNYISVAKAAALAKSILGEDGVKQTYVHAHGTGTPQNRVTESHILDQVAKAFGIEKWTVTGIKAYVGHSMGPAGGDQLAAALGTWEYGYIPGITTITHIADDVYQENLDICMAHKFVGDKGIEMKAALLNSKGFGGNNATGLLLSPHVAMEMLSNKYGADHITAYQKKNETVREAARNYDVAAINGDFTVIYHFGTEVMEGTDLEITSDGIKLKNFAKAVEFSDANPFADYCK